MSVIEKQSFYSIIKIKNDKYLCSNSYLIYMKQRLTILQLNDSHGYFELHPELFWSGEKEIYRNAGGYAHMATLFNEARGKTQEE